jgi:hypothetical protein
VCVCVCMCVCVCVCLCVSMHACMPRSYVHVCVCVVCERITRCHFLAGVLQRCRGNGITACLVSLRSLLNSGDDSVMVLTCSVRSILIQVAEELLQHSPVCATDIDVRQIETCTFPIAGVLTKCWSSPQKCSHNVAMPQTCEPSVVQDWWPCDAASCAM